MTLAIVLLVVDVLLALLAYRRRKAGIVVWLALLGGVFAFTHVTAFLVVGTIGAALLLGQPLFVLMGALGMILLANVSGLGSFDELTLVVRKLLELASKEVLLAIPFFVVAGELMTQGSLARRLVDVMRAAFGGIPGGLAVAAVAGCVFFAAISGSSPVTVVAIGSIMVPALIKAKYPEPFSIGLLTSAGSLGILIPPSIPMIVYSIMVSATTPVDPTDLFIAGILPGLFIGLMLAGYSVIIGLRHKIQTTPFSAAVLWREVKRGFWSLMLPVIILGGIYSGVFTATEAAAVSVIYALVVEVFIHGDIDGKKLLSVAEASMTVMGSLLVIIALAITLNYFLVLEGVPDLLVEWLKTLDLDRTKFLILVNLILLVVGCFMDIMSAILIIAPMLAPMAGAMGIHPVHMGIIFIVNLEIGYLTPPVGLNLFVSSSLFKKSLGWVIRAVLPTLGIMMGALMVITWVPALSLTLVEWLDEAPPEAPAAATPDAPPDGEGGGKVKSLDELMREQREGAAAPEATPGKVKSLEELMREQREKAAGADDAAAAPAPAPPRVKSLDELMREQREKAAAEAADDADDAKTADPPPVDAGADGAAGATTAGP